ncbi:hypothetical protein AQS8620_01975 [Aquimixticola soesokkakensis]|uniref:Lipoprotein n=1 Tax=Aquimixticola soesokkakensis TaxID=1519096 RepID=A0A1Y5SVX0_9RHOB|nr:hypothetical protein [Aquimixticola soesokkakensis]SLN47788.1 hypothetical protein AQS8620_01975 [Aquimixticola soesokkakensis]
MRSILFAALPAALALSACTQQDICINGATRDLRVVNSLTAQVQRNLDRGYAMEEYTERTFDRERCGTNKEGKPVYCTVPSEITRERPVAIDLAAEAQKLASLQAKQKQLSARAAQTVASCKAQFPES